MSSSPITDPIIDHNVYILGAGFSFESGIPLIQGFLNKMADSLPLLRGHGRTQEVEAIRKVFDFKLHASSAAYRSNIDLENIEDLFSLASMSGDPDLMRDITRAIAATIDCARSNTEPPKVTVIVDAQHVDLLKKWTIGTGVAAGFAKLTGPKYELYAGYLSNLFAVPYSPWARNTVLTFNYDTLLEDALYELDIPFDYDFAPNTVQYENARCTPGAHFHTYKLHGSVNWTGEDQTNAKLKIRGTYEDVRTSNEDVHLIPPTWHKYFGPSLTDIWSKAVRSLQQATRVIIVGFSIPPADTHFKYLIAAGLKDNISLRSIIFVNPAIAGAGEERFKQRVNGMLHSRLAEQGLLSLQPHTMEDLLCYEFLRRLINRSLPTSVFHSIDTDNRHLFP